MASRHRTLKLPPDLADISELLAAESGYPSWGAYIKGLIQYHALTRSRHTVTVPWSRLPLEEQDQINARLLARVKAGEGMTTAEAKAMKDWRQL